MTAKQVIKLLEANGFREMRQRGSHKIFKNPKSGRQTTVPQHAGDLKPGTLHKILKDAGLK